MYSSICLCIYLLFAKELADCMAGDKRLNADEASGLAGLIEAQDTRVMKCYMDYVESQVRALIGQRAGAASFVCLFVCGLCLVLLHTAPRL